MNDKWLSDARKIPGETMNYIRKMAVRAVIEKNYTPESVIDVFGLSTSCIYEWLKQYREGGYDALDTKYPQGMKPTITEEMDVWLKTIILSNDPTDFGYDTRLWTCDIITNLLEEKFGVHVIGSTVNAHLKKIGLTYQKPEYRASELDPAEVEYFLHDKFPKIQKLAAKIDADIAFEDESGVYLNVQSGRTWGAAGETPEIAATDCRGKFNVLSIVTHDGEMRFSINEDKNINSDAYLDFVKQLLKDREKPLILIVDHATFHGSKKVRDFVRSHRGRIRVYFLPKHAPQYNPDEQVWNHIKNNKVGRQPVKDKSDLKRRLFSALRSLQKDVDKVKSFFRLPDTQYAL